MEHDFNVLEYYDQPPPLILEYAAASGRRLTVRHTPDFFVIRADSAGWEECKTEDNLRELEAKNPNRYCRDNEDRWRCLPGEACASSFGLYYRVRSSAEIDWVYQRNVQFLEDYLREEKPPVAPAIEQFVRACVLAEPAISLKELFVRSEDRVTRDDVYHMIAADHVSVDLRAVPLADPARVRVFADRQAAMDYGRAVQAQAETEPGHECFDAHPGSSISWDGKLWRVANVGVSMISLLGDDKAFIEMPLSAFESLVRDGRIAGISERVTPHPEIISRLTTASEESLGVANHRVELVRRHLRGQPLLSAVKVPDRTLRFWVAKYRAAQNTYGSGYIGLLPQIHKRGNRSSKLPSESRAILDYVVKNDYETLKQKTRFASWAALKRQCDEKGILAPSYMTFCAAVKQRPKFDQTLKRQGPRAAYVHEAFYDTLEQSTPRHGDRPFEIAHIDHTELDIELVCSHTRRNLGRAWMTLMTDAFSRRILALYLSFDSPSYRSCMMILRDCVRRHARLPQIVVVDGGAEFESTYFETLLARYECTKKTRPPAKARFGSVCERLFGTSNTQFVHNLAGNTQVTKNVRQVTKSVNPKHQAEWTLGELYESLCEWAYEVYDTISHPALGQSPREAFMTGLAESGNRPQRIVAYDEEFRLWTLPTTARGTARVVPGKGVKINHVFYWASALREPDVEESQVPVRYDPYDAGAAYAYVHKRWVQCISECYSSLHGKSERELMLATAELRRRAQKHTGQFVLTAKKLADFLACAESDGVLGAQRTRDREAKGILTQICGDVAAEESRNSTVLESGTPEVNSAAPSRESPRTLSLDELAVYEEY
jgi:putative transposase